MCINWNIKGKLSILFLIMHGANRQSNLYVLIYPNTQMHSIVTNCLLECSLYTLCAN